VVVFPVTIAFATENSLITWAKITHSFLDFSLHLIIEGHAITFHRVVMSRRKHILSFAASSEIRGGVRRVFTAPASGTFTIKPRAHFTLIGEALYTGSIFI